MGSLSSCAVFPATSPHELSRPETEQTLHALLSTVIDRIYGPAQHTVKTLDPATIDKQLLATLPTLGLGSEYLQRFLQQNVIPWIRDYRHPSHYGHQRPAPSVASIAADLISATFNPTVTMYEGGPISVAIERRVLAWFRDLCGFPSTAVGTLLNGGADSVLTALLCARDRELSAGTPLTKLRLFIGEHTHYTARRAAHILGLPVDAVVTISSDPAYRMDKDALSHELEQCVEKGERPFALVATAGTTLNAAFDDLASFSAICRRFGTWFHVDAAHGGAAILSEKLRYKLAGLDSADSLSINPHKLMWISSPCSMLFVKDHRFLRSSLAVGLDRATYVVPDLCSLSEPPENSDPLQWTIACTRHFTALRIYSALITYGREGIAARLENVCRLARDLYTQLLRRKDEFEVLGLPELNIVCFRYRTNVGLMDINQQLRTKLAAGQEAYLTGCSVAGTYWLRAQIMSENVTESSNTALLSLLSKTAKDLIR